MNVRKTMGKRSEAKPMLAVVWLYAITALNYAAATLYRKIRLRKK